MATHKNLHKAMHLIPENALCGNTDIIPGVDEQKSRIHGNYDLLIWFILIYYIVEVVH